MVGVYCNEFPNTASKIPECMVFDSTPTYSRAQLRRHASAFLALRTVSELADLLDCPYSDLERIAYAPRYQHFKIPKRTGDGYREIEDPVHELKALQIELNLMLQSVYHFHRTEAAYGFLLSTKPDPAPRNIRTNAERHLGNGWMLNADFEDFFHAVSDGMLRQVWKARPFQFQNPALIEFLTRLCTYGGRLPMGASTSPILSNWASVELDNDLMAMARQRGWTYTRFADDLTFSSAQPITSNDVQEIRQTSRVYGFRFNEQKLHLFSPNITKMVTGLVVADKAVDLPDTFMAEADAAIDKFKVLREAQYWAGDYNSRLVAQARHEIAGFLRFARFILSDQHPEYRALKSKFEVSDGPINPHGSISWLHFSNYC